MEIFASLILVLLQNVVFGQVSNYDYSKFGPDHTMNKYKAKACPYVLLRSKFTRTEIETLVDWHNEIRSDVARGDTFRLPSASNMQEMKWDPQLAEIAQRWADQCVNDYDIIRLTETFPTYVEQIVASSDSDISGGETIVNILEWLYDGVNDIKKNAANINPFKYDVNIAHPTQIIWAETNRIGCGFAYFYADDLYQTLLVCNYGPGGNLEGRAMYHIGKAATDCTSGQSTDYEDLCAS